MIPVAQEGKTETK